jgi:hypothetical protein
MIVHLTMTPEMLSGVVVTFCFNGPCVTGTLPAVSPTTPDGVVLTGTFEAVADVTPEVGGARVDVGLIGTPSPTGFRVMLADGDVYRVSLADGSGATLFDKTVVATYAEQTVCGIHCQQFAMDAYP